MFKETLVIILCLIFAYYAWTCTENEKRAKAATGITYLTQHNGRPRVLCFGAKTIGSSNNFMPVFAAVTQQFIGAVDFQYIEISDKQNKDLSYAYDVSAVPTIVMLDKKGKVVKKYDYVPEQLQLCSDIADKLQHQPDKYIEPLKMEVARRGRPRIIEFYRSGCGICQRFEPVIKNAQDKYTRQVDFAYCDIDAKSGDINESIYSRYPVSGTLPIIYFLDRKGNKVEQTNGYLSPAKFDSEITELKSK